MTIPWLANCEHTGDGWCPDCVRELGEDALRFREALETFEGDCLAFAKRHKEGGDEWCRYNRLAGVAGAALAGPSVTNLQNGTPKKSAAVSAEPATLPFPKAIPKGASDVSASNYVHLDVDEVIKETDKAFLVALKDGEELWLPKSQLADPDDYAVGDTDCTISVTQWLAKEKDLA